MGWNYFQGIGQHEIRIVALSLPRISFGFLKQERFVDQQMELRVGCASGTSGLIGHERGANGCPFLTTNQN